MYVYIFCELYELKLFWCLKLSSKRYYYKEIITNLKILYFIIFKNEIRDISNIHILKT